jgi:serine/threonine protein kinase/Flp pilus assembly protein TadD
MHTLAPTVHADRIGNYQVLERLGAGGMGVVYKALDLKLNRTVALKFLAEEGFDPPDRERLLREARAASALDHANIGTVYGVEDADDGRLFIVMAFYDGETLAQKLRHGPLSRERSINIACQVARGLQHAHLHGVVHRDIKPSNVILTSDGVAKIVDFGLARRFTASASTQSGGLSGTLLYMSPEQAMAKLVDARSDIWSLGVMLYQMLTGRLPFSGENAADTLLAILHSPPAPLDDLPEELQLILYRGLAKDPIARYQNCAELLREIEKFAPNDRERTASISRRKLRSLVRVAAWSAAPNRIARWLRILGIIAVIVAVGLSIIGIPYLRKWRTRPGPTVNQAAQDAYQTGEFLSHGSQEQRQSAKKYFEKAIAIDPDYAPAYAGLADYYWAMWALDPREAMPMAKRYAIRALELDPRLAKTHNTLASIYFYADFNWNGADEQYRRALELSPNYADGHSMYSVFLAAMSRPEESLLHARRYRELDAISARGRMIVGWSFYYARRYQSAIAECRAVLDVDRNNANAYECVGSSYLALGQTADAISSCSRALELAPDAARKVCLGRSLARAHRPDDARQEMVMLIAERKTKYVPACYVAMLYAALGQKNEAFAWLSTAYDEHDRYLASLKVDESYDPLRSDPRFAALLRRVGLPQ